jgi:hypothetical protein
MLEQGEINPNWVGIWYEGGRCGYAEEYCGAIRVQITVEQLFEFLGKNVNPKLLQP